MKRFAIVATAVVVALAGAATAFAATTVNSYKATYSFKGSKGTASKPTSLSFDQVITVTPATAGNRTGILHQIKTTIDGAKVDATGFPTCTASKINAASSDTSCSKKALIATGSIKASLGPSTPFTAATGQPCDPLLHVWNGGHGKLIFFFVDSGSHQCLGGAITTGTVPPWTATYKQAGKNLDVTIPIPNTVDYPAGMSANEIGSLSSETLDWKAQKEGSHYDIESTGCSGSKRKYEFSFNASLPSASAVTNTVKGEASCN